MKKILMIQLVLLMVAGCAKEETIDIQLKTDQIEVMSEVDGCTLVAAIDGTEVISDYITNQQIQLPGNKNAILCPEFKPNRLGPFSLEYVYRNKIYAFNVTVVDTTSPVLLLDTDTAEVEQGNPYFELTSLYSVQDNFDPTPLVSVLGSWDIDVPGEYTVQLTAKDASGNTSKKDLTICIVEKEKEIVEVQVPVYVPVQNGSSGSASANQDKDSFVQESSGGSSGGSNSGSSSSSTESSSQDGTWTEWTETIIETEVTVEINTSTEIDGVVPN